MSTSLHILTKPAMKNGTLLLALGGWMDGGLVSTGTVKGLMSGREVIEIARIDPDAFYIYNFPGSMEVAALFRPEVKYDDGLVTRFELPSNIFRCDPEANLVFFTGREPNLRWQEFADCIFELVREIGVRRIIFMGSFGGAVPHTRQPRLWASVSDPSLKPILQDNGFRFSDYGGPASFATLLLTQAVNHGLEMMSLACEIPGYLEGANPLSIEAVTRRLAHILNIPIDLERLRKASDEWEVQVTAAVEKDSDLANTVRKLEEQYDNELIGHEE